MFPRLFEIPGLKLPINSYGFAIMVGFLLGTYVAVRRGRKLGVDTDLLLDIGIIGMIFGILGAKLNYVLQYAHEFEGPGRSIWDFGDGGFHPLGALVGVVPYVFWFTRTRREPKVPLLNWKNVVLLVTTFLFALIGARGWFIWRHSGEYNLAVYKSWQSGFVLYGGLIFSFLSGAIYARMRGESIGKLADLIAPSMMLGLAFGRLGCFLNGCCFGHVSELPWAVEYPRHPVPGDLRESPAYNLHMSDPNYNLPADSEWSLAVHPTQLYETLAALAFFFFLSWLWKRAHQKSRGEIFLLMSMLYAGWRFFLEYLRADKGREVFGAFGMTYSQTVSAAIFAVCLVWMLVLRLRAPMPEPSSATPPDQEIQPPPEAKPPDKPED